MDETVKEGRKVLVVEDEGMVVLEIESYLEEFGFEVASNTAYGERALEEVRKFNPNLILMDINLKGSISGLDAAKQITEEFEIPIVFLTAYSDTETIKRVQDIDSYGYLVKPFHKQEFKVAVEMALHKFNSNQAILEKNKKSFQRLANNIWDFYFIGTLDGSKVFYQSPELHKLFDSNKCDLEKDSRSWINCVHQDDVKKVEEFLEKRQMGEGSQLELRILSADGTANTIIFQIYEMQESFMNQDDLAVYGFIDLAKRKELDNNLKIRIEEIERALKTKDIDLQMNVENLAKLSLEKEEILRGISHEMRTPLNAIKGYGQLLQLEGKKTWTQEQKTYLDRILKAGDNLIELVDNAIGLSKIKSGEIPVSIKIINLNDIFYRLMPQFELLGKENGIQIFNNISSRFNYIVLADPNLLDQAILNLISNAVKFNKPGGIVKINCENLDNKFVRVRIHDTGIGIPKEKLDAIFDPFIRLEADWQGGSHGLGLSTTKSIIDLMGGSVSAESELGAGSIFSFTLPLEKCIEEHEV